MYKEIWTDLSFKGNEKFVKPQKKKQKYYCKKLKQYEKKQVQTLWLQRYDDILCKKYSVFKTFKKSHHYNSMKNRCRI